MEEFGGFVAGVVVFGFGLFLYNKIKASRNRPPSQGGGGRTGVGGGDRGKEVID